MPAFHSSSGSDYRRVSRVYFRAGQTSATYPVTIYDDTVPEEAEVFFMSLISNDRDVYTQSLDTAKVTIEESDCECCANTLYICEHNQSIPIDYTCTSYTTLRCDA